MDKNDLLQFNHSNIQELIRFIDQKAGALLVIYVFLFTATIEFAKDLKFVNPFAFESLPEIFSSSIVLLLGLGIIALLMYQVYVVLFEVIKPRNAKSYTQEEQSIVYFEHISKRTKEDFINHFEQIPENTINEVIQKEMTQQVYEISCIMSQKSEKFNSVLKYLFISTFLLLAFIFFGNFV